MIIDGREGEDEWGVVFVPLTLGADSEAVRGGHDMMLSASVEAATH